MKQPEYWKAWRWPLIKSGKCVLGLWLKKWKKRVGSIFFVLFCLPEKRRHQWKSQRGAESAVWVTNLSVVTYHMVRSKLNASLYYSWSEASVRIPFILERVYSRHREDKMPVSVHSAAQTSKLPYMIPTLWVDDWVVESDQFSLLRTLITENPGLVNSLDAVGYYDRIYVLAPTPVH